MLSKKESLVIFLRVTCVLDVHTTTAENGMHDFIVPRRKVSDSEAVNTAAGAHLLPEKQKEQVRAVHVGKAAAAASSSTRFSFSFFFFFTPSFFVFSFFLESF